MLRPFVVIVKRLLVLPSEPDPMTGCNTLVNIPTAHRVAAHEETDGIGCVYPCLGWFRVEYPFTERTTYLDFFVSDFENVRMGTQGIF